MLGPYLEVAGTLHLQESAAKVFTMSRTSETHEMLKYRQDHPYPYNSQEMKVR
jgi:hypothetical protein